MLTNDPCLNVFIKHLGNNAEQAETWADYVAKFTFGQDPYVFDLKRDLEGLESLERALNVLSAAYGFDAMTEAAAYLLQQKILFGPYTEAIEAGKNALDTPDNIEVYLEETGKPVSAWLNGLEAHLPKIRDAIQASKQHIKNSPHSKIGASRMNFEAIQLVDSARNVWQLSTGQEAPLKGINLASPFGQFLCDLFDAYQVDGDPRAAFRAWSNL